MVFDGPTGRLGRCGGIASWPNRSSVAESLRKGTGSAGWQPCCSCPGTLERREDTRLFAVTTRPHAQGCPTFLVPKRAFINLLGQQGGVSFWRTREAPASHAERTCGPTDSSTEPRRISVPILRKVAKSDIDDHSGVLRQTSVGGLQLIYEQRTASVYDLASCLEKPTDHPRNGLGPWPPGKRHPGADQSWGAEIAGQTVAT